MDNRFQGLQYPPVYFVEYPREIGGLLGKEVRDASQYQSLDFIPPVLVKEIEDNVPPRRTDL